MEGSITVIYENGVLRPLTPLQLPERTCIRIRLEQVATEGAQELRRQVQEVLAAAGIITMPPIAPQTPPSLSPERREELALKFSVGGPLSELIIEERQKR